MAVRNIDLKNVCPDSVLKTNPFGQSIFGACVKLLVVVLDNACVVGTHLRFGNLDRKFLWRFRCHNEPHRQFGRQRVIELDLSRDSLEIPLVVHVNHRLIAGD
jgi:hypothetical protein